jgi:protease-4
LEERFKMDKFRMTLFSAVLAAAFLVQGCAFVSMDLGSLMKFPPFEEKVITPGSKDKVLVVEVLGTVTTTAMRDLFPKQGTVERLDSVLEIAKKDKNLKGIILKIDSPGGTIAASDLVYKEIMNFKAEQKIPVVACVTGMGTSGGYMAALSADRIIAVPSSMVGNVGVLLPSISLEGLMDKLGIRNQTLTSGKLKDSGSPLRDMTSEDRAVLEGIVKEFQEDFLAKVKKHRPVTPEDLAVIQDGRVMTASTGLKHHLIDQIGYYEDALKAAELLTGSKNPTVVVYRRNGENYGGFYSWP